MAVTNAMMIICIKTRGARNKSVYLLIINFIQWRRNPRTRLTQISKE